MAKAPQQLTPQQIEQVSEMLKNAQDIKCSCGCDMFSQANKIKKVSRLITGEEQDTLLPLPALYCIKCSEELVLDNPEPKSNIIKL
jgi:hypothetical protein